MATLLCWPAGNSLLPTPRPKIQPCHIILSLSYRIFALSYWAEFQARKHYASILLVTGLTQPGSDLPIFHLGGLRYSGSATAPDMIDLLTYVCIVIKLLPHLIMDVAFSLSPPLLIIRCAHGPLGPSQPPSQRPPLAWKFIYIYFFFKFYINFQYIFMVPFFVLYIYIYIYVFQRRPQNWDKGRDLPLLCVFARDPHALLNDFVWSSAMELYNFMYL